MHSWKKMVDLLERVNRANTLGFQADMAHTLLYILGFNAPEDAILPAEWDWSDPHRLDDALKTLTTALRPWTIDFHVAQNDATVKGSGTHDKTGHHCLPNDPNGKLTIAHHAGYWLHGDHGSLTKAFRHICWDGCMFPNEVMMKQDTWNDILRAMISVRDAHGWREEEDEEPSESESVEPIVVETPPPKKAPARKPVRAKKPARKIAAKKKPSRPSRTAAKKKAARKPARKISIKKRPAKVARKTKTLKSKPKKTIAKSKSAKKKSSKRKR